MKTDTKAFKKKIAPSRFFAIFFALSLMTLFIILLAAPFSLALTVSPAQTDIYYQETYSVEYKITNDAGNDVLTRISFENELAQYAQAPDEVLVPANGVAKFIVTLAVPELSPGPHDLGIVISQVPLSGQGLTTAIELVPRIRMIQRYDGAFIVTRWSAQDWSDPHQSTITLTNYGDESTDVLLELSSEEERTATNLRVAGGGSENAPLTLPRGILPKGAHEITLKSTSTVEPEINNHEERRTVNIGTPEFTIIDAQITDIEPGEIARISLNVTSDWNSPLKVRANARVEDDAGKQWNLGEQEVTFSPEGTLAFIWESTGADYGEHTITLGFTNGAFSGATTAQFTLEEPSAIVEITEKASVRWSLAGLIVLIIFALILFLVRKHKEKNIKKRT